VAGPVREGTTAKTRREAVALAFELEAKAERQRRGLDPLLPTDRGGTLWNAMQWWLKEYRAGGPSYASDRATLKKHFEGSRLGGLTLQEVTPTRLRAFLKAKQREELSPRTVNALRMFVSMVFNKARKDDKWPGLNPAEKVDTLEVLEVERPSLLASEVPALLAAVDPSRRPLFAAAIYTGARKGELFGALASAVNLEDGTFTIAASHDRKTTKGKRTRDVPIAPEARPYFGEALDVAQRMGSAYLFPGPDGSRQRRAVKLEVITRTALSRAHLVSGYEHKCYRRKCGHVELAKDHAPRKCPKHGTLLGATGIPRALRFHDLRAFFITALMRRDVSTAKVQRIVGHRDPRTTMKYERLVGADFREAVTRLRFFPDAEVVDEALQLTAGAPLGTNWAQAAEGLGSEGKSGLEFPSHLAALEVRARRESNPRPSDSKSDALSD
jgi:integrase